MIYKSTLQPRHLTHLHSNSAQPQHTHENLTRTAPSCHGDFQCSSRGPGKQIISEQEILNSIHHPVCQVSLTSGAYFTSSRNILAISSSNEDNRRAKFQGWYTWLKSALVIHSINSSVQILNMWGPSLSHSRSQCPSPCSWDLPGILQMLHLVLVDVTSVD